MIRKIYYIIALLFINPLGVFAGNVHGHVWNSDGEALAAVTVQIKAVKKYTYSNKRGEFKLTDIKPGDYKLTASRVGCRPLDTLITVGEGGLELELTINDVYDVKKNIVITGTRTAKQLETNPIATSVLTKDELNKSGSLRLDDALSLESGMTLVDDGRVRGIQIQGLDPAYALILINGEPVIGREGGVIDLERFAIGNLKRIEIVKGPSSSIYGSNALAGVINLITDVPNKPFTAGLTTRYEKYNTLNISAESGINLLDGKLGANLFFNRLSTDGYSVDPNFVGQAVPEYQHYTASSEIFYKMGPEADFKLQMRRNWENQQNYYQVAEQNKTPFNVNEDSKLKDFNGSLSYKRQMTQAWNFEAKTYYANYTNATDYTLRSNGAFYDKFTYDESLYKMELSSNLMITHTHIVTMGLGQNIEKVKADRIESGERTSKSFYSFLQMDWVAWKDLNIIMSGRYDDHTDYESNFSPKVAASWTFLPGMTLKGSVGTGYKAPTFQQLFLDWNNPAAGYSVYGVNNFKTGFQKLLNEGAIADTLINPSSISKLSPESSVAINAGFFFNFEDYDFKINVFRNDLTDMIEVLPVAAKTNGMFLYTYFNLNSVYTQGLELGTTVRANQYFTFDCGFQYLEAYDNDIIDQVKAGKIFKIGATGINRPVQPSEYGGLFNRSKYSGNVKVKYSNHEIGFSAVLKANIRGEYGYKDNNNNQILDNDGEYAPATVMFNAAFTQDIKQFTLQVGCDNILNEYNSKFLAVNPGRNFFISLGYKFEIDE